MDNPESYRVLYVSDSPAGAVAEAFGNHAIWTDGLFAGRPDLPGSCTCLAEIDAPGAKALDLDDAQALLDRELKPSAIVTRDRAVTRAWALRVQREKRFAGVRWWSYYDSRWGSYGFWDLRRMRAKSVTPLDREHAAVLEAAATLARPSRT